MKIRFLLFLIALLLGTEAWAQKGFSNVRFSDNIPSKANKKQFIKATWLDDNIYAQYQEDDSIFNIYKWNGAAWSKFPQITLKHPVGVGYGNLEIYNNELYYYGSFESANNLSRGKQNLNIIKFNGSTWKMLPSYPGNNDTLIQVHNTRKYKDKLYYSASVKNGTSNRFFAVYTLDKNGQTRLFSKNEYAITLLETTADLLMIGGQFDSIGGQKASGMVFYDGQKYIYPKPQALTYNKYAYKRNDSQILICNNYGLELWEKDSIIKKIDFFPGMSVTDYNGFTFYKQYIFCNAPFPWNRYAYYDLDSGKWNTNSAPYAISTASPIPAGPERALMFNKYTSPNKVYELIPFTLCSGSIFIDMDSNCNKDLTDFGLQKTLVAFNGIRDSFYTTADSSGNYELFVPPDTYKPEFSLLNTKIKSSACSKDTIKIETGIQRLIDFPLRIDESRNLYLKFTSHRGFMARQGFTEKYELNCINLSSKTDSCIIKLEYPSNVTMVNSSVTPFSSGQGYVIFKFYNIPFLGSNNIDFQFSTSISNTNIGDILKFNSSILNSDGDKISSDNVDTLEVIIVAGYDPNIKQCNPEGSQINIPKKITYHIHFQNKGTDTAFNVSVMDTLDPRFDISTLNLTSSSHPDALSMRLGKDGALLFHFSDIKLPSNKKNEIASQGYVAFEVNLRDTLKPGDTINNKAFIYFDYQAPIITNTAYFSRKTNLVSIEQNSELNPGLLIVYPNPASNFTTVNAGAKYADEELYLYDINGRLICKSKLDSNGETSLDVSVLKPGIYCIQIISATTKIIDKIIVE